MITLFLSFALFADISTHLALGDVEMAAECALIIPKDSDERIYLQALQALGKAGRQKEMMELWKNYHTQYPDQAMKRECLECISWEIIQMGANSSSPFLRQLSFIAAFFGQDAVGVAILSKGIDDSNVALRATAAELCAEFRDRCLSRKIQVMAAKDPEWIVRQACIRTLGKMEEQKALLSLLQTQGMALTEQEAIVAALLETEIVDKHLLEKSLLTRILICAGMSDEEREANLPFLKDCLNDPHPGLRQAALRAIGPLKSEEAEFLVDDVDPEVGIAAAYVLTLHGKEKAFLKFLTHPQESVRMKAAAALAATGHMGLHAMQEAFEMTSDPFIKATLALGLIGQREAMDKAPQALLSLPKNQKLMWLDTPFGRAITKSTFCHNPMIPNFPEVQDQLTRLEILGILTFLEVPDIEKTIEAYLESTHFGVTALASVLLLTEGPQGSYEGVKKLLGAQNKKLRLQAALILSLWGEGEEAIPILIEDYPTATREMKERILEGLGRIASPISLPFLIERLNDEAESVRIIAAAAVLKCLYA